MKDCEIHIMGQVRCADTPDDKCSLAANEGAESIDPQVLIDAFRKFTTETLINYLQVVDLNGSRLNTCRTSSQLHEAVISVLKERIRK